MRVVSIYDMRLHETIHDKDDERLQIIRVPGGWLYVYFCQTTSAVFVPWHDEFQKDESK